MTPKKLNSEGGENHPNDSIYTSTKSPLQKSFASRNQISSPTRFFTQINSTLQRKFSTFGKINQTVVHQKSQQDKSLAKYNIK
jgi:hypothetical protein